MSTAQRRDGNVKTTHQWTLWGVALGCVVHPIEEFTSGWPSWAGQTLGIVVPTWLFVMMNAILAIAAITLAPMGWRRSALTLIIPVATLLNAIVFHIGPSIAQRHPAPGIYSAVLLYVPFGIWALVGAARDGVAPRNIVRASIAGTALAFGVVAAARAISVAPPPT
jgi:hypothetical protein